MSVVRTASDAPLNVIPTLINKEKGESETIEIGGLLTQSTRAIRVEQVELVDSLSYGCEASGSLNLPNPYKNKPTESTCSTLDQIHCPGPKDSDVTGSQYPLAQFLNALISVIAFVTGLEQSRRRRLDDCRSV